MRKKKISQLVLDISGGLFSSLTDLVLWNLFYMGEMALIGSPGKIGRAGLLADRDLERFNSETLKRAIYRAKCRGFIKEDFGLTKEGMERLKSAFPRYFGRRKWDGNWYLVIYDVPESKRIRRNILRENLKRLGFGQLQASVWVSPFNFFGEMEKVVRDNNLSSYVVLAISDKLGREEAKVLAGRVWPLSKINALYKELLDGVSEDTKKSLYLRYLNILRKDPQLPEEILPHGWEGESVCELFKDFNLT